MNRRMTDYIARILCALKRRCEDWVEWQRAKEWAKLHHPAWVEIVTRTKSEEARAYFKKMILGAYRGDEYV